MRNKKGSAFSAFWSSLSAVLRLNIVLDRIYNAKICDFGLTQPGLRGLRGCRDCGHFGLGRDLSLFPSLYLYISDHICTHICIFDMYIYIYTHILYTHVLLLLQGSFRHTSGLEHLIKVHFFAFQLYPGFVFQISCFFCCASQVHSRSLVFWWAYRLASHTKPFWFNQSVSRQPV